MMNIRNFHLKSNLIAFHSEDLSLNLNKEIAKKQRIKIEKALFKNAEPIQIPAQDFIPPSNFCQNCESIEASSKPKPQKTILDFDPPLLDENKRTIKNRSCTLSPKKMLERSMLSYQSSQHKHSHHKRRFSDTTAIKKQNKKSRLHSKTRPDIEPQNLLNPDALKRYTASTDAKEEKTNQKSTSYGKTMTKLKVFEMDNFFSWNPDEKIIHSGKNGSPFITTLPSKRRNFRTTKSNSLKERKPQNTSSEKTKVVANESIANPQSNQKNEDFNRSIHTATSGTARRIDYDRLVFSPVSTGFFPQSSIWNRNQEFIKNVQVKPRSYKLLQKASPTSKNSKVKENPCRPWSPIKADMMIQNFEQEEVFPEIREH